MDTAGRVKRWRELERALAKLVRAGWAVEELTQTAVEGEPLRATVALRYDPPDYREIV